MLMTLKALPSFGLVRREEKEVRLRAFIAEFLSRRSKQPGPAAPSLLVLARSAESPVAKAAMSLAAYHKDRDFSLRAIFAMLGTADTTYIAEACRSSNWTVQIRWARDLRLMDAHEQLVLDETTSWIGDCMRREPLKHDAFEAFSADCAETARGVTVFFERLWQVSEPIIDRRPAAEGANSAILPATLAAARATLERNPPSTGAH
jgi:hypothetical protein